MAVSPAEVQRLAQQCLIPDKLTIVVVGDKSKIEDQLGPFGTLKMN
jgi:predicted Zn-dependent peptidase